MSTYSILDAQNVNGVTANFNNLDSLSSNTVEVLAENLNGTTLNFVNSVITNSFKYIDGNQQDGYILTSDADGNAAWEVSPPNDNLGNHRATDDLDMDRFDIVDASEVTGDIANFSNGNFSISLTTPKIEGVINVDTDGSTVITLTDASVNALKVISANSQTADIIRVEDSSSNELFSIRANGQINAVGQINAYEGIRFFDQGSMPTCDASIRGSTFYLHGTGIHADELLVCIKTGKSFGVDQFDWREVHIL
jgi:hypothetical protein